MPQRLLCFSTLCHVLAETFVAKDARGSQDVFVDLINIDDFCDAEDPHACDFQLLQQRGTKSDISTLGEGLEDAQPMPDKIDMDHLAPEPVSQHITTQPLTHELVDEDVEVIATTENFLQLDGQDVVSEGFTIYWVCPTMEKNSGFVLTYGNKGTILGRSAYKSDPLLIGWDGADSARGPNKYPEKWRCISPTKPKETLANGFFVGAEVYYKCKSGRNAATGFDQTYGNNGIIIGRSKDSNFPALVRWAGADNIKGWNNRYPESLGCLSLTSPSAASQATATAGPTFAPTTAPRVTTTPNWAQMMDPSVWSDPKKLQDMMKKWQSMWR